VEIIGDLQVADCNVLKLDGTDRSQVAMDMRPSGRNYLSQMLALGFGRPPARLRGSLKTCSSLRLIEPEVIVGQRLTALPWS
jgi:hypothetical protein